MIDLMNIKENTWSPNEIDSAKRIDSIFEALNSNADEYISIFKIEPYIEALYICRDSRHKDSICEKRIIFHEGYAWTFDDDNFFREHCLHNQRISYTATAINQIFEYYSEHYPDWKLQRYYTKPMRLLDHIYHCMNQGTGKEILYKAGLDELADNIDDIDEINLLSSTPSDIYDGVPLRVLRALNCREGSRLLSTSQYRVFLKDLNLKFPDTFKMALNDAQCKYLMHLIDGNLTVGETGRLFKSRRLKLSGAWAPAQYQMFLLKEKLSSQIKDQAKEIAKIDPIYAHYFKTINFDDSADAYWEPRRLIRYILYSREETDKIIRRSNRKRNSEWQERSYGYVVRYPQTINDFCREAIYMSNCLMTYLDAFLCNETTILFVRENDDVNKPFITMEIYEDELMQAYHRFNEDCTLEEAIWICDYCDRHGIGRDKFKFNKDVDLLY